MCPGLEYLRMENDVHTAPSTHPSAKLGHKSIRAHLSVSLLWHEGGTMDPSNTAFTSPSALGSRCLPFWLTQCLGFLKTVNDSLLMALEAGSLRQQMTASGSRAILGTAMVRALTS